MCGGEDRDACIDCSLPAPGQLSQVFKTLIVPLANVQPVLLQKYPVNSLYPNVTTVDLLI